MLRAIADLDPHEGRIFLDDVESQSIDAPEWRRMLGMLPAHTAWWHDSVGEHFPKNMDLSFETLGLPLDVMQWPVSRLSMGEGRRLSLLRLLCRRPKALLLDEPTANLDPDNTKLLEDLIASYQKNHQAPVIWVCHDKSQAARIADRAYRFSADKRLVEDVT